MKRKDLDKWARAASTVVDGLPPVRPPRADAVRMRDFPAVQQLEQNFLVYGPASDRTQHEVLKVCRDLFGVDEHEIYGKAGAADCTTEEEWYARMQHLDNAVYAFMDVEAMEMLLGLGVDFRDERGNPLRCTNALALVAEAAAKGVAGRLPDRGEADAMSFEEKLKRDRDAFLRMRHR
jgi:hypothetical protein